MRPKHLKIEGLQSFKEAQEVDFDMLGETGLFGIFGPTGSGKSTILDAMTLALFGNVQRANRGTQGIINTDVNNASVSFTFDLFKDNVYRSYKVERLYRRKKADEIAAESKMARLIEITDDGEVVLADKEREVTATVIDLIGLEPADFTRSVVLPQNKFQEFLLLDKAKKRDMMERIFYLEEYGRKLADKVNKKLSAVRFRLSNIEGAISSLGDVTKQKLIEAEGRLKQTYEMRKKTDNELQLTEVAYQKAKEKWELVRELQNVEELQKKLEVRAEEISDKKKQYENAIKAGEMAQHIEKHREFDGKLKDTNNELSKLYEQLPVLEEQLNKVQEEYEKAVQESEKNVPIYIEKRTKLKDALMVQQEIAEIAIKIKQLRETYISVKSQLDVKNSEFEAIKASLRSMENEINDLKQKAELSKTDIDYRKKVIAALKIEEELQNIIKEKEMHQDNVANLSQSVYKLDIMLRDITGKREAAEKQLKAINDRMEKHEHLKPCERTDLIIAEREYLKVVSILGTLKNNKIEKDNIEKRLNEIKREYDKKQTEHQLQEQNRSEIKLRLNTVKAEGERYNRQYQDYTVYTIASQLKEDEPCPVCGSMHHPSLASAGKQQDIEMVMNQWKSARETESQLEQDYRAAEAGCIQLNENCKNMEKQILQMMRDIEGRQCEYKEIVGALPESFREIELTDMESMLVSIQKQNEDRARALDEWEKELEEIKKEITKCEEVLNKYRIEEGAQNAEWKVMQETLAQAQKLLMDIEHNLHQKAEVYNAQISELCIKNAAVEYERIEKNDRYMEELQKQIGTKQEKLNNMREQGEQLLEVIQESNRVFAGIEIEGKNLRQQKEEKEHKIKEFTDNGDIETELKMLEQNIHNMQQRRENIFEALQKIKNDVTQLNNIRSALEKQREIYRQSLEGEEKRLQTELQKRGFVSINEVEQAVLSEEEREVLNNEIIRYQDTQDKLETQKELILIKLKGERITEEKWIEISDVYAKLQKQKEECISQYESAKNHYHTIKNNFERWLVLNLELQDYSKKQDMLLHIQKLLKGNSFVEFISEERLRYIAREASDTLEFLTKYRYTLELDVDNGFVVSDNANGGACRLVSTLSGGETFLTSLSLSLALSKQIQLKGQSPLEFFFLDEGFGMLDTTLLDTVIDALERLSTTERVIGLISHVPIVKDRMSRRLIVEPPALDGKGSRLRIEKA